MSISSHAIQNLPQRRESVESAYREAVNKDLMIAELNIKKPKNLRANPKNFIGR
jgi:hypothetical protein